MVDESPVMGKEEWRAVIGHEGLYEVSDRGRVRSLISFRIMALKTNKSSGYLDVGLHKDKKRKTRRVHQLVAAAFLGPRPDGLVINHKDGSKKNNHVCNLEYCTYSHNAKHAFATGLSKQKLTPQQVIRIKADLAFAPPWAVARRFGVSIENIKMIRDGKIWVDVGPKVKPMKGADRRKLFGSW